MLPHDFSVFSPMTDIRVEMAVSVAMVASWRTDFEHDSIDVMENPMGLYWCCTDRLGQLVLGST